MYEKRISFKLGTHYTTFTVVADFEKTSFTRFFMTTERLGNTARV